MKVSIITSCYNREATIRGAIESVLEQDYPYIEYIVVDGASKDNSLAVINEYKNGIDTIISEPDKGMYEAINKGIRAATGDIIGLIHSDDFLFSSHTISDIVKTFEEQDADMIYGNGVFVDYDDTNLMIRNWISGRYSKENVKNGWLPLHPTVYIKKECMDKWGLYDESYKIAADSDLLVRYLYEADLKVYYLNKYIVKMRMGGLSTDAGKSKQKWAEDLRMYKSHGIKPISALKGKILSKIPQFIEARLPWSEIPEAEEESLIQPDEIYNLAAQSHVKVSFDVPEYTAEADAVGTLRMLEAVRILGLEKKTKIYQASTSELFGLVQEVPQKETTPFYPRSPYGVAKQYGFWITKNYRESYGMFAVNGILFNHESERRGETFVTRKITLAAARIAQGFQDKLYLGNLNSLRDWGYAKDYVECMWLILQHDTPEDFVIATGEYHTVREFATLAFKEAGIDLRWEGEGVNEKGIDTATGKVLVEVDPKYFRPAEVEQLLGDPTKAKTLLGWNPRKTSFEELVKIMVKHDMKFVKKLHLKASC